MYPTGFASVQGMNGEKAPRGCRSWTKVEEDALIECLIGIVQDGWKVDNWFKAGFQRALEKAMRKKLLGTDIVTTPHINSKIHVWKKEYSNLTDLLSKSGIGWNSTTSMVEVEDEGVWDASRKWLEIFGKDRATVEHAVDPTNLFNEMLHTCGSEQEGETGDKFMPCSSINLAPGMFMKQSDATFNDIAKGMGSSKEKTMDNNKLNDIMSRIVGLKIADKLKVCDELVQNTNRLDFFMSLPEAEQDEYVWMLLDGRL
ncbi:hypothetical protein ACS0TY_013178 [Phlomoides rotata]